MAEDYINSGDLADFMGNQDDIDVPLADMAVAAAQSVVRQYLGSDISLVEDEDLVLDGSGRASLVLPQRPVRSVTDVVVDDDDVDEADYFLRDGILYLYHGTWHRGHGNVVLTYSHGYGTLTPDSSGDPDDDLPVPDDLKLITLIVARRAYQLSGESPQVASETMGSYSYTLAASAAVTEGALLLPGEKAVLWPYRRS